MYELLIIKFGLCPILINFTVSKNYFVPIKLWPTRRKTKWSLYRSTTLYLISCRLSLSFSMARNVCIYISQRVSGSSMWLRGVFRTLIMSQFTSTIFLTDWNIYIFFISQSQSRKKRYFNSQKYIAFSWRLHELQFRDSKFVKRFIC